MSSKIIGTPTLAEMMEHKIKPIGTGCAHSDPRSAIDPLYATVLETVYFRTALDDAGMFRI
jgi:hypothetical protein